MPVQHLLLDACVGVPHSARLVAARRDDFVALWVELDLRYLVLVPFEQGRACSREHVVDACKTVGGGCGEFVSRVVERGVQHLVVVPFECLNTLTRCHVPQFARPIY